MARKQRFFLKGNPCHIVQRGHNRQACFFCDDDYGFYINSLEEALLRYHVQLHAFVLMTNHVHLLLTPETSEGISRVMQSVGRDYVRYVNKHYQRTGTLFEGRYKASLIDSDLYYLQCQRYIELNPVRAMMVPHPANYHWSSYQFHALGKKINCLTPHELYLRLGDTEQSRLAAYKALFTEEFSASALQKIRQSLMHNYPLGDDRFRKQIEHAMGIKLGKCGPGRPELSDKRN
ncbi:transposase [Alishewanella sp. d11]|uniref:transposase n=1 Tax=Alishewanella sp. d11 TaxID=3414030 RepID=UPI003BF928CB